MTLGRGLDKVEGVDMARLTQIKGTECAAPTELNEIRNLKCNW